MEHYLGEKLKKLRESRGWTQADLAKRLNKAVSTISGYESVAHAIPLDVLASIATVYKGNIIKNLIMDCQSYTKYRPNETTGGIFVSWRRKEELPTGA